MKITVQTTSEGPVEGWFGEGIDFLGERVVLFFWLVESLGKREDSFHIIKHAQQFWMHYFLFKLLSISDSFKFLPILEESTLLKHTQHFFHLSNKMIFWVADPMIARRMSKHPVPLRHWPKSAAPNRQDKSRQQLFSKRNDWMVE